MNEFRYPKGTAFGDLEPLQTAWRDFCTAFLRALKLG